MPSPNTARCPALESLLIGKNMMQDAYTACVTEVGAEWIV